MDAYSFPNVLGFFVQSISPMRTWWAGSISLASRSQVGARSRQWPHQGAYSLINHASSPTTAWNDRSSRTTDDRARAPRNTSAGVFTSASALGSTTAPPPQTAYSSRASAATKTVQHMSGGGDVPVTYGK